MFLISFEDDGKRGWGVVKPEIGLVFPCSDLLGEDAPTTLLDYIRSMAEGTGTSLEGIQLKGGISLDTVRVLAPIPNPVRNIFCVGKNYIDHIKELDKDSKISGPGSEYPSFFTKATNTINGPYDSIPLHDGITNEVDYEAELAVIIGKGGANIREEDAMEHVFGYTIINDVTARDLQRNHTQWFKGKSLDGFCPMGPWIVTRDEIGQPVELNISSTVNGEIRQNSNTKAMIFNIPRLISILSKGLTLEPGDILATGTPSGVGMGFEPPKLLKKNDVVRIEIEDIGYIENKVGSDK